MRNKVKYIIEFIIILVLFVILAVAFKNKYLSRPAEALRFESYIVHPGDTLWDIAEQYTNGADPRELIYEIQVYNGINADIRPGEEIKIPIYK